MDMEISRLLFEQILEMFIMLLMGFLLVKKRILKVSDSKILSVILLYLAIPCAILSAFQAEFDKGLIKGLLLYAVPYYAILFCWQVQKSWEKRCGLLQLKRFL